MTIQMKALDKYFLMVVFTLLLNRVHVFAIFYLIWAEKQLAVKELNWSHILPECSFMNGFQLNYQSKCLQQLIKCKLLFSIYSQLGVVQYGEFGRWSLVGVKVCLTTNSPNTFHTFCSGQVGRIKIKIFGALTAPKGF